MATETKPSDPADRGNASGVQPWPTVGLKSALLSMDTLARQMRASTPKIELLVAVDVDVGDLSVDHVGEPGGRDRHRNVAGRGLRRGGGERRRQGRTDEREHDEQPDCPQT